jgi:hypothetical protein
MQVAVAAELNDILQAGYDNQETERIQHSTTHFLWFIRRDMMNCLVEKMVVSLTSCWSFITKGCDEIP